MKRSILLILVALVLAVNGHAQVSLGPSTVNCGGGYHVLDYDEYEWSIGEMTMVTTFTNPSIVVTQGVLQPFDIFITGVGNTTVLNGQIKVFPNPANSEVNLQYTAPADGTLSYSLLDMDGKLIKSNTAGVVSGTTTEQINVSELACATYMLEVTVNHGNSASEKTSYKIQKLK